MIEFSLIGGAMIVVCLALVLIPLWRSTRATGDRRRQANIEVYRQRCKEIERDRAADRITADESEVQKEELGARLLDEIPAASETEQTAAASGRVRKPWLASALSVILIAAGGAATYGWLGDWQAMQHRDLPNVDQMIAQLKNMVAQHPADQKARLMLVQVQQSQGQYSEAAHNLAIVNRDSQRPDADLLVAETQMRLAAGEDLSGRVGDLLTRAVKADPDNVQVLWYLGLRASEAGNDPRAVAYWRRILEQNPPDEIRSTVQTRINALMGNVPGV